MDHQQLLQLIKEILQARSPAQSAVPIGLTSAMRLIEQSLEKFKSQVAPPALPLPSAESIAAFAEGNATADEQRHVTSASIHDLGILLQLVSTLQALAEESTTGGVGEDLQQRLLEIGNRRFVEPPPIEQPTVIAKPVHDFQSSLQVARETRQAEPDAASRHEPPYGATGRRLLWFAALAAAACFLLAVGWLAMAMRTRPTTEELQAANLDRVDAIQNFAVDGGERQPERANSGEDVNDQDVNAAEKVAEREQESTQPANSPPSTLAAQDSNRLNPREPASGQDSSQTTSVGPAPLLSGPTLLEKDSDSLRTPSSDVPLASETTADAPAIVWTDVTGILARSTEGGYDRWRQVRPQLADEVRDAPNAKWLTLPTCYAKGQLSGGGQIAVGDETSFQTSLSADRALSVQLDFGSIVLIDFPTSAKLQLSELPTDADAKARMLEVAATASFELQRVLAGLQVAVVSGRLNIEGQQLAAGQSVLIKPTSVEAASQLASLPEWAVRMPDKAAIPRNILANLDLSMDLSESLEKQIWSMFKNLNPNSAIGVSNFRNLCRWRASLAVEDSYSVTVHPQWPLRMAMFDMLLSDQRRTNSIQFRQSLMRKLLAVRSVQASALAANQAASDTTATNLRSWIDIARGAPAARQDFAAWLRMLIDDDPQLAAFGDYLLRKKFPHGPGFAPLESKQARSAVQQAWAKTLAAALN